jgi:subtilase family serine protease
MAARGSARTLQFLALVILALGGVLSFSQPSGGPKPELHPTTLILTPASPVDQGRLVNVSVKLENSGEVPASEFKVEFFIRIRPKGDPMPSWNSFAVAQRQGLSPHEQEVQVTGALDTSNPSFVPAPDIYEIRVVVDSNDQIPESDETNNEFIVSLLVQASSLGRPDLRPQALTFEPPSPVPPGEMVFVKATVINSGDKDAGPFDVGFSHCRITEGQSSCPNQFVEFDRRPFAGGLPRNSVQDVAATLDTSELKLEPGIYLINVTVDPPDAGNRAGQITEQDEANNDLIAVLSLQGPELHPIGLSFDPALPRLGDTVNIAVTIENSGQGTARNVEVAFFVDGAQFDRQVLATVDESPARVQGFLRTAALNLDVGIHSIRVVVDPNNRIAERDETNNEIRTALTLQPPIPRHPELHAKSLTLNPRSPIELDGNSQLTILSEIVNTGQADALGFEVAFSYRLKGNVRWIPLPCTTNCLVTALSPGTGIHAAGALFLLGLTPGNYEVRVVVDPADAPNPNGRVLELDESNNEMQTAFTLLTARKPDLTIDPFSIRFEPPPPVRSGAIVALSVTTVNVGERAAGAFAVEYSLRRPAEENFIVFARDQVDGLEIGGQKTLRVTLDTLPLRPGLYEIQIAVDPENRIDELNEGNNFILFPLEILSPTGEAAGQADLTVRGLTVIPDVAQVGDTVQVTAEIANIGQGNAGPFRVVFFWQRKGESRLVFFAGANLSGLGPGGRQSLSAQLDTSFLFRGQFDIIVVADYNNEVAETNEENNRASKLLRVN